MIPGQIVRDSVRDSERVKVEIRILTVGNLILENVFIFYRKTERKSGFFFKKFNIIRVGPYLFNTQITENNFEKIGFIEITEF